MKATVKYGQNEICSDIVKITVFEVTLTGLFNGAQQADCDVKMSDATLWEDLLSSDRKGKISWDDADGNGVVGDNDPNCEYFHDCMECQGTVKPHGVTTEVTFDFRRDACWKIWHRLEGGNWGNPVQDRPPWQDDNTTEGDEDKTPSGEDHIYEIDGPGMIGRGRPPDYTADIMNLREYVCVLVSGNWRQCSDFYKWHHQMYTMPKAGTVWRTRSDPALQKLGGGWINIPNNP